MDIIRKHEIPGSEIKDFLTNSIEDSMSIMLVSVPPDLLPPTGVMQWVLGGYCTQWVGVTAQEYSYLGEFTSFIAFLPFVLEEDITSFFKIAH